VAQSYIENSLKQKEDVAKMLSKTLEDTSEQKNHNFGQISDPDPNLRKLQSSTNTLQNPTSSTFSSFPSSSCNSQSPVSIVYNQCTFNFYNNNK
jgi:hypothetical protein